MKFRTPIDISEIRTPTSLINYQSKIGLMGSCFVENIGKKLAYYKYNNSVNPFGILFNPVSIERVLQDSIEKKIYTENDLIYHHEIWHSLQHHSDFSNIDKEKTLVAINENVEKTHLFLKEATHLIITLGTAWVYQHIESNSLVANCHKIPQNKFRKRLLSIDQITDSLEHIYQIIRKFNPNISLLITLSPVRHLKDGMINNSRSKAHLLSAIHQFVEKEKFSYFPSYELVMDDLRDYRFFEKDMLHTNEIAIDYIWNLFKETYIDPKVYGVMKEVESIQNGMKHRPFMPDSIQHQDFVKKLHEKKARLYSNYGIVFD
jgi:hypothetical protein